MKYYHLSLRKFFLKNIRRKKCIYNQRIYSIFQYIKKAISQWIYHLKRTPKLKKRLKKKIRDDITHALRKREHQVDIYEHPTTEMFFGDQSTFFILPVVCEDYQV